MRKIKLMMKKENGLTLIEVLAAISILSIVFIGFMTIFPQMTAFNKKTGTKLQTMNIRQQMVDIQDHSFEKPLNRANIESNILADKIELNEDMLEEIKIRYQKGDYKYEVVFSKKPDLSGEGHIGNQSLHRVQLKVLLDGKVNSETYGYIEVKE